MIVTISAVMVAAVILLPVDATIAEVSLAAMHAELNWFINNPKQTVAFFLLLLILILGAAEYFFARNLPATPVKRSIRLKEHRPSSSRVLKANRKALQQRYGLIVDGLQEKEYRLRVDENGFIMPGKVHERPDLSMVFLGDSTTECTFVDEESRFAYRAGVLLGERFKKKINSYNAGVTGSNSMHCLSALLNKILALRPQVVALKAVVNDINVLLFWGTYWNDNAARSLLIVQDKKKTRRQRLRNLLAEIFFPGLCHRFQIGEQAKQNTNELASEPELRPVKKEIGTGDYEANLTAFVNLCRAYNVMPVLMTQCHRFGDVPDKITKKNMQRFEADYGIDYETYKKCFDRFNDAIRKVARAQNVCLIDLDRKVLKERAYLYDIYHLNTAGSELAADFIATSLAANPEFRALLQTHVYAGSAVEKEATGVH